MSDSVIPIGFKEWSFVCEALGQGAQTLILRKGGIHEGKKGFQFQHKDFWLFPTGFHAQEGQLKWLPSDPEQVAVPKDEERFDVKLKYFAKTEEVFKLSDWSKVDRLRDFHIWQDQVVKERFAWNEESCLHLAIVRVYRLKEGATWEFPYLKSYGGCRSWLKLPEEGLRLEEKLEPVLSEEVYADQVKKIQDALKD